MLNFELTEDGQRYRLGKQDKNLTVADIPFDYRGKIVSEIGEDAFRDCTQLTEIVIPDNIQVIGEDAFWGCRALTKVECGNGVKRIGAYAFFECTSLVEVYLGSNVEEIGSQAFYNCMALTEITFPASVKRLGSSLFFGCCQLRHLYTLATKIPKSWGDGWSRDSLVTAYPLASLKFVLSEDGKSYLAKGAHFKNAWGAIIPKSYKGKPVTEIHKKAFKRAKQLSNVRLPSTLVGIGASSFYGCKALTYIDLPQSVQQIGPLAFYKCKNLSSNRQDLLDAARQSDRAYLRRLYPYQAGGRRRCAGLCDRHLGHGRHSPRHTGRLFRCDGAL